MAISIVALFLLVPLSGCIGQEDNSSEPDEPITDGSITTDDDTDPSPVIIDVPDQSGCDNLNPHHCMLPFPSDAFLVDDDSTATGLRVNIPPGSIPASGSTSPVEIPRINQLDGMSTVSYTHLTLPNE